MAAVTKHNFKVGDIVKHKGSFLRSCGWVTSVPKDGRITEVDAEIATVEWCDGHANRINCANIMHAKNPDYSNL